MSWPIDWKTSSQRIPAPRQTVSFLSSSGIGGIWPSSSQRNITGVLSEPALPPRTDSSMSPAYACWR